jgi:hypothetical protein
LYSADARPEMLSTSSSAGCFAASIARRTARMSLVTPVEVSLCTTHTALIACCVSAFRRSSIFEASTPRRQPSAPGRPRNSVFRPQLRRELLPQRGEVAGLVHQHVVAGLSTFASAASQAPVPEAG